MLKIHVDKSIIKEMEIQGCGFMVIPEIALAFSEIFENLSEINGVSKERNLEIIINLIKECWKFKDENEEKEENKEFLDKLKELIDLSK